MTALSMWYLPYLTLPTRQKSINTWYNNACNPGMNCKKLGINESIECSIDEPMGHILQCRHLLLNDENQNSVLVTTIPT